MEKKKPPILFPTRGSEPEPIAERRSQVTLYIGGDRDAFDFCASVRKLEREPAPVIPIRRKEVKADPWKETVQR